MHRRSAGGAVLQYASDSAAFATSIRRSGTIELSKTGSFTRPEIHTTLLLGRNQTTEHGDANTSYRIETDAGELGRRRSRDPAAAQHRLRQLGRALGRRLVREAPRR